MHRTKYFPKSSNEAGLLVCLLATNFDTQYTIFQNEIENYGNYMTEKGTEISSKNTKDAVDDARKEIPTIKKMVKSVLGIYDNAVKSCRTDDKFSVTDFVFKFIDLFENLDDDTFKSIEMLKHVSLKADSTFKNCKYFRCSGRNQQWQL